MTVSRDMNMKPYVWAFHCHHRVLAEPLTEEFSTRRQYIKDNKPDEELTVRLTRFRLIQGKLPDGIDEAWDEFAKTKDKDGNYSGVFISPYLEMLHRKECLNCPWNQHPGDILEKNKWPGVAQNKV